MTELKRSYPYPRQLLLNGVYDLTEGTGGKIQKLAAQRTPAPFRSGCIPPRRGCRRRANCGR